MAWKTTVEFDHPDIPSPLDEELAPMTVYVYKTETTFTFNEDCENEAAVDWDNDELLIHLLKKLGYEVIND